MQLALFEDPSLVLPQASAIKTARSGSFVDNMTLPVHRWFRYSAGFAAEWVGQVLDDWGISSDQVVLDPFAGSGTVSVVCDGRGARSISVEAHPMVARVARAKLSWPTPIDHFTRFVAELVQEAQKLPSDPECYPALIQRSFEPEALTALDKLKRAWIATNDRSPEAELAWLAITAILRPTASASTAQWQYILPNKTKSKVVAPQLAFQQQVEMMKADMRWMQAQYDRSVAEVIQGDARYLSHFVTQKVDAVITSPPYANNYDYADALRFEMSFWGEVENWGDIHDKVRKFLIVSSSQHSSRERMNLDVLLAADEVTPIRAELAAVTAELASVRQSHGGKKHYHTMLVAYCRDIARVLRELRAVCRPGARMCWVIGDSAPYGVYAPIERWVGELALAAGFTTYRFQKLRDRNVKWRNRKHRVPLKEGLLWIEG